MLWPIPGLETDEVVLEMVKKAVLPPTFLYIMSVEPGTVSYSRSSLDPRAAALIRKLRDETQSASVYAECNAVLGEDGK